MFYYPHKKYPLLYNIIIRNGLAAIENIPSLDVVGKNAILHPFVKEMPNMNEAEYRNIINSCISIYLHNAFFCKDFPIDKRLKNLFITSEKKLKRISTNPWVNLLYKAGIKGQVTKLDDLDTQLDPLTQMKLSLTRPEFEKTVPALILSFVDWFIDKRKEIELWQLERINDFA